MTVNDPTSVDAYGNPLTSSSMLGDGLGPLVHGNGNTTDMGGGPPAVIIGTAVSPGHPTGGLPAFVSPRDNTSSLALPLDFNQSDFSLDFSIYTTSTDQETIFSNSPPGGNGLSGNTSLRIGDTTPGILTLSLHRRQAACQQRRIPLRKQSLPCHGSSAKRPLTRSLRNNSRETKLARAGESPGGRPIRSRRKTSRSRHWIWYWPGMECERSNGYFFLMSRRTGDMESVKSTTSLPVAVLMSGVG